MRVKLNTKMRFLRWTISLVFVITCIFSNSIAFPNAEALKTIKSLFSDDGQVSNDVSSTFIENSSEHQRDFHARLHSKFKIKCLTKKANAGHALNIYPAVSLTADIPSFSRQANIAKPDYYLFLFRYTLF